MITFNTRRAYTLHGQRIAAAWVKGGILFADVDRNVDGFISAKYVQEFRLNLTERDVMWAYDRPFETYYYDGLGEHEAELEKLKTEARKL